MRRLLLFGFCLTFARKKGGSYNSSRCSLGLLVEHALSFKTLSAKQRAKSNCIHFCHECMACSIPEYTDAVTNIHVANMNINHHMFVNINLKMYLVFVKMSATEPAVNVVSGMQNTKRWAISILRVHIKLQSPHAK